MGRVVVEHDDGRRVAVEESDFNKPESNPFNGSRLQVDWDNDTRTAVHRTVDARPENQHVSLKAEGFRIVADLADADVIDPKTGELLVHAGAEMPRQRRH